MVTLQNMVRRTAVAGLIVVVLGTATGCDWDSPFGWTGSYLPTYGYYDPTGVIQDVIGYRQDVMDNTATAWDQYIRGDYDGGGNDDPSTPDYWASGPEW